MTDDGEIRLQCGTLELLLAPKIGGSIASFNRLEPDDRRIAILRPAPAGSQRVLEMGCFPLVPYCNRIRDGRFHFRGREVVIARNAEDPSPLHGQGWVSGWTVERHDSATATLSFRHPTGEWPWTYEAHEHFSLSETALDVRLTCRNLSSEPMPCGLGLHPYYPCDSETELDTTVEDVWTVDELVLPVERRPATGRYDLRQRRICGQSLDNGYSGWSGAATIRNPGLPFELVLTSSDARFFQVYSPDEGGLFVAEPVSHANAALNEAEEQWPELGMRVLEPGEEMSLSARFELR